MRKILLLILAIFGTFGVVSCSGSADETTNITDENMYNEQIEIPTNLAISNKLLTWDEVENATGYRVYIDGVLEEEVSTNSFDFSGVEGDYLIFTVKALAPTGMQNSNMSVTLAYVLNRNQEIANVKILLAQNNMNVTDPDGFAAEIVDKGMLASDFDQMMTEFTTLSTEMEGQSFTLSTMYEAIDGFMDSMNRNHIEAFISSLIKYQLPSAILEEIAYMQDMQVQYGVDYSEEIRMNQATLTFLDENADEVVRSAMLVIDYIMDVEEKISTELVTSFEALMDAQTPDSMNINLAITIKNELINNFKDSLPELQDVVILNRTLLAFMSTLYKDDMNIETVNVTKTSAQSLMSIELFYNYLLAVDSDYVQGMLDAYNQTEYEMAETTIILNLTLLDEFIEDNQALIQEMNDMYTVEEQEVMFFDYQVKAIANQMVMDNPQLDETDVPMIQTIFESNIDFNDMITIKTLMNDQFNELLDALIESDFAVIKDALALSVLDYDKFDSWEDYHSAYTDYTFGMYNEIIKLINPIIQDMTLEEYQSFLDLGFGFIISSFEIDNLTYGNFDIDQVEIIKAGFEDTATNQLQLLQLILNEFDNSNFWSVYGDLAVANTQESAYEIMILIANTYINVYDAGGETHLDAITSEIISIISDPDNMLAFGLTSSEVNEIETLLTACFGVIYNNADTIKDYDASNLTTYQITNIEAFIQSFTSILY